MKIKPIIIINGEPNSIFIEIFFKALKFKKYKSPIILISSFKLIKFYMKKFKFKKRIKLINIDDIINLNLDNKSINLINISFDFNNKIKKITKKSNYFIKQSFQIGLEILQKKISYKFINGPISKKTFLKKNYPGITEYIAKSTNTKKYAMLIYNKDLSVCPLTTHVPLKKILKFVTKNNICEKVELIHNFYVNYRKMKPKIAVLGLNPHCESTDNFNEDEKIIKPSVKNLKQLGYKVSGPFSADTIFTKNNRKKFDVILGMYHDQVLTPLKTIHEYDAINITIGLPFLRISPDHGPNISMVGKNISNPLSLINAISFLDKN